mmetsp:Transcript_30763/g.56929  ORF Transcript_30763/g.56929 Transcript_30763/m.56929 type:complete len:117 (-) Transcript_30763:30-380(-)
MECRTRPSTVDTERRRRPSVWEQVEEISGLPFEEADSVVDRLLGAGVLPTEGRRVSVAETQSVRDDVHVISGRASELENQLAGARQDLTLAREEGRNCEAEAKMLLARSKADFQKK